MANHKVNLALIPLNGTNYLSANDSSGGLSLSMLVRALTGLLVEQPFLRHLQLPPSHPVLAARPAPGGRGAVTRGHPLRDTSARSTCRCVLPCQHLTTQPIILLKVNFFC